MSPPTDPNDDHDPPILFRTWRRHVADDVALLERLLTRHREKHRRYHGVDHLDAVVAHVDDLGAIEPTEDLGAVVASAFYHDAVYEPASPANERASARLARRDLAALGWTDPRAEHVARMIEATVDHATPPDVDHAVLFDADLATLGAPPDAYARYVTAVRAEYHHVDDDAWRVGRRRVLESFLDRPSIFSTPTGRDRWEASARSNVAAELDALSHPPRNS